MGNEGIGSNKKNHDDTIPSTYAKEDDDNINVVDNSEGDLTMMDYTPVKRKSPIHHGF